MGRRTLEPISPRKPQLQQVGNDNVEATQVFFKRRQTLPPPLCRVSVRFLEGCLVPYRRRHLEVQPGVCEGCGEVAGGIEGRVLRHGVGLGDDVPHLLALPRGDAGLGGHGHAGVRDAYS